MFAFPLDDSCPGLPGELLFTSGLPVRPGCFVTCCAEAQGSLAQSLSPLSLSFSPPLPAVFIVTILEQTVKEEG